MSKNKLVKINIESFNEFEALDLACFGAYSKLVFWVLYNEAPMFEGYFTMLLNVEGEELDRIKLHLRPLFHVSSDCWRPKKNHLYVDEGVANEE